MHKTLSPSYFFFSVSSVNINSVSELIGDSIGAGKFSHSPYDVESVRMENRRMKKKSRMQNNGVINKRNGTPCRDHTQTTDHNNKRNNAMDCHPYAKRKVMRKKTGSKSDHKNLLNKLLYLNAMRSLLFFPCVYKKNETVVET